MRRYFKKCEEFSICSEEGEANHIFAEHFDERRTLFQIMIKGSGRVAIPFRSEFVLADAKKNRLINMKKYLGHHTIFESHEPFHIYGFNSLSVDQDWSGKLINESFDGDDKSYLICFKGNPIINGIKVESRDYAKLTNKWYDVDINDSIVGVFTKL